LGFFLNGAGPDPAQPFGLARTGPTQSHVYYSAAACKNEFCMQRPRRRRRRQHSEEKVAWLRGLGRVEDVGPVAQEASTEVMVAGVGCGRKKKKLQRREKG